MYVVFLKFSENKANAGAFMDGHKAWLKQGFDDGVFLLAGSLKPEGGGGILAHGTSQSALEERVAADPFVAENVVKAEITEIAASRCDDRLAFLLE